MDVDISISLELLILLDWLIKHEKPLLDNAIKHSLKNGLTQKLNQSSELVNNDTDLVEQFYPTVIEFLSTMENSLVESLEKTSQQQTQEILPLLKKINLADINMQTIYLSKRQTNKQIKNLNSNKLNTQQVLYKQILKNWKPSKKDRLN